MSAGVLICIVDDDGSAREAVAALVRSFGFTTQVFESAAAFLHSGALTRTSCLIADLRMPEMGGLDLHRHLVASGAAVPTILMTAFAGNAVRTAALEAGICCYLSKPVQPEVLLGCIRRACAD